MKKNQFPSVFRKTVLRNTLLVAGLTTGLVIGSAQALADDEPMPQAHSDGIGAAISDTAITGKVKAKLMGDDGLKSSKIHVTTTNGIVTLKGSAASSDAKSLAEERAKAVEGVKGVDYELKTANSSAAADETKRVVSDSWITTKVKSEILADSVSKGFDVSVETKNGVVVLSGKLGNQDAIDHVKDIASKVKGVKSVETSALVVAHK
jgi:hyperosmotically inducible protein